MRATPMTLLWTTLCCGLLLLSAASSAGARTGRVMIVDDTCFHDLSLCKHAELELRPSPLEPAAQERTAPAPARQAHAADALPPPSLTRLDARAIGMTREQLASPALEKTPPGALVRNSKAADRAFTRCIEASIRAGNALGESTRVCSALHPE